MPRGYARTLSNAARRAAGTDFGKMVIAGADAKVRSLLGAAAGKVTAKLTPSVALKGTKLKSYLDKTYAKKCGVEVKHYQNILPPIAPGTTLSSLSEYPSSLFVPQNLTDSGRVGNTIEVKSLKLRMTVAANALATQSTRVRMFLVKMGQVGPGVTVPPSQLLWLPGSIRSPQVLKDETTIPFTVLKEWAFDLSPLNTNGNDRRDITFTYVPKTCHHIVWQDVDTTGDIVNITNGAIVLYAMFETFGLVAAPLVYQNHEFDYIDI